MSEAMRKRTKKGRPALFLSAGLFCFTLFVYAPFTLYLSNQTDFIFAVGDFLPYCALYGVGLFLLLILPGLLLPQKARRVYTALLFALAVCLFLQGNFLNPDYGTLDGRGVKWGEYAGYAALDTAFWIAFAALSVFLMLKKTRLFARIIRVSTALLLLFQAGTLAVSAITTDYLYQPQNWSVTLRGADTLSRDKNTVIFLVDACDTQYFERILKDDPERVETWDGFTYYPDFAGSYSKTKMSLPFILSGKWYENQTPVSEFLKGAYQDVPLYGALAQDNYSVGLYTLSAFLDGSLVGQTENIVSTRQIVGQPFALAAQMTRFSAFSFAPHLLKPYFEFYTGAFNAFFAAENGEALYFCDNYLFRDIAGTPLTLMDDQNAFRFYHLTGSHLPSNMDREGSYVGEWQSTAYEQTLGVFRSITAYMEQMKALGIYDDATIIVMADHGRFDEGVAFPTFVLKTPDAHGAVQTSAASASQAQLHATILAAAGLPVSDGQTPIQTMDEEADVARRLLYYPTSFYNGGYLPDLTEYQVTRGLNYAPTGSVYTKDGVMEHNETARPESAPD